MLLLTLLLALASAWAQELALKVDAQVLPDLRTVRGELTVLAAPEGALTLVEVLSRLPQPTDDLTRFRTYPARPEAGALRWTPLGPGRWSFEATLPRRFGALGAEPGEGLWANGGWLPQVLVDGALLPAAWLARVELPPGVVGALNDQPGEDVLRWRGRALRLSLAALAEGRLQALAEGVWLLDRGPRSRVRERELRALLEGWPGPTPPRLVIVETPDPRRLTRPGEGLLYLSDQAFRLSPPLVRFHRDGVREGLYAAAFTHLDRQARGLVAAALAQDRRTRDQDAGRWLRFGAWIPVVDALLYTGRAPFHAEVFGEAHPGDPLADDLLELLDPTLGGRALAALLDDLHGPGAALALAVRALDGTPLAEAARQAGLSPQTLADWARPPPAQELRLTVRPPLPQSPGWQVTVRREAPPEAPAQPLIVRIDGQHHLWVPGPGPDERTWTLPSAPRGVVVDPERHWQQDPSRDAWPARLTAVFSAYPTLINPSARSYAGEAGVRLRRRYDTHNAVDLGVWADEQTQLGGALSYTRALGPLLDRRVRPHRLSAWAALGWFSPGFRPTDAGRSALELGLGWVWDSRVYTAFPQDGARLSAALEGGVVPGAGLPWGSARLGAVGLWSPHPRVVLASRALGGVAWGEVDHRLLPLGGGTALRGLPAGAAVGQQRALVGADLRVMPLRDLGLNLGWVYWLDELQLTAGLEAAVVGQATLSTAPDAAPGAFAALGWSAGVLGTFDGLGLIPGQLGVTLAGPLWLSPGLEAPAPAQVLVRWGQDF